MNKFFCQAKHCLIVDDSSAMRGFVKAILQDLHFRISEASNGLEALRKCRRQMPDAVLVDSNMPVMTGLDFLKALREEQGGDRPKVIFCTAKGDAGDIVQAIEAGANEYLMKPFDRDIIAAKLHEIGLI